MPMKSLHSGRCFSGRQVSNDAAVQLQSKAQGDDTTEGFNTDGIKFSIYNETVFFCNILTSE